MRIVSGIQPTGNLHLGNYLGAIRNWVRMQDAIESDGGDCLFFLADLHALSMPHVPAELASNTREMVAALQVEREFTKDEILELYLNQVFFGGDAAFGPKNIIWAVAHGHAAAVSIDMFLNGQDIAVRPAPGVTVISQKMGIHEWSYDNDIANDQRYKVPHRDKAVALKDVKAEVELGFD